MSNYKIEIKWAFVFICSLLLWSLIEKLSGFHDEHIAEHPIISMFFMLPAVAIYIFALKEKKHKYYNGKVSFGQIFKTGLIISMIIAIVNPGTQWIISNVISPEYFTNAIKHTVEGGFDTLENATSFFTYQSYVVQGILFTLFMGLLTTIIVGMFIKSEKE